MKEKFTTFLLLIVCIAGMNTAIGQVAVPLEIITSSAKEKCSSIIPENLPETAGIRSMGDELSQEADFSKRTSWLSFKTAISHLSDHYTDWFGFSTDKICIEHGPGKELATWSSYVRNRVHTTNRWRAGFLNNGDMKFEWYMNPSTIEKFIYGEKLLPNSTITIARWPIIIALRRSAKVPLCRDKILNQLVIFFS